MQDNQIHIPTLALVSFISSLLPVFVGMMRWKMLSSGSRIFLGLLTFYLFVLAGQLTMIFHRMNTMWTSQLYTLIEFSVLASVFIAESKNQAAKKAVKLSILFFCFFWILAKFTFESITKYDNFTSPVAAILLISAGIFRLIELLGEDKESIFHKSQFWIWAGVVIYAMGTMPLFSLANILLKRSLEEFASVWTINWSLTIGVNLIYSKAFLCRR